MANREEFLGRVSLALGHKQASVPQTVPGSTVPGGQSGVTDLAEQFKVELERVGGRVARVHSAEEINAYLTKLLPPGVAPRVALSDGVLVEAAGLKEWYQAQGAQLVPPLKQFQAQQREAADSFVVMAEYKQALLQAELGITSANFALADTGTLVLLTGGEQHRLMSLVPPIHVCLLDPGRLRANLPELIAEVYQTAYRADTPPQAMTFITGPSRTGDIELTLTMGVHGPKELHVLLYQS